MIKSSGFYDINCGDLLVAPPSVKTSTFEHTVILLGQHNEEGTQGWVMNRDTGHGVREIIKDMGIQLLTDIPLYWGGPVSPQTVWMLHSSEWSLNNTREINSEWSVTSNEQMFHHISNGDEPQFYRVFMGYTGWADGQLQEELVGEPPLKHNTSWLVLRDPDTNWLIDRDPEELWSEAISQSVQQTVAHVL